VDVADGQAVRLVQGEAGSETRYGDPLDAALAWQSAGAEWIHLVDLDAAFGRGSNRDLLAAVVGKLDVRVELSGGIRDDASLEARDGHRLRPGQPRHRRAGEPGVDPDGHRPVRRPGRGRPRRPRHDARGPWLDREGGDLWETLARLDADGCARYVVTDVTKDGTLPRPEPRPAARRVRADVAAGRGQRRHRDARRHGRLRGLVPAGVEGAIVGKALYAGAFTLPQALDVAGR
jgi:phosphoribosylanthranilate isomerase